MIQGLFWILAISVGAVAAWKDWKYREVPNGLWILGLALATPLLLMELWETPIDSAIRLGCAIVFFAVLLGLWFVGTFGGADMKGFAFFGLVLSPVGYFSPWQSKFFPALDVLVTSLLLAEILRRILKERRLPLFAVAQWPLLLVYSVGGLAWWPIVWLLRVLFV